MHFNLHAQTVLSAFKQVTTASDVTVGKITSIAQDRLGYLWMVDQSSQALLRYDGYELWTYHNIPGDSTSMRPGGVEALCSDKYGNIWLPRPNYLDKYDPVNQTFRHYRLPNDLGTGGSGYILADHLNMVWFSTSKGLVKFDVAKNKFHLYPTTPDDPNGLSCNVIRAFYEDKEGTVWIGTGWPFGAYLVSDPCGGLYRYNRETDTFTRFVHDDHDPESLINNKVRALFEDSRGNFWVGTQGDGLHIMDRKTGKFKRFTYDPAHPERLSRPPSKPEHTWDHITFISEDGTGCIWIGTYTSGLVRYNPQTGITQRFCTPVADSDKADCTTWTGFVSRDGTLWVATEEANLYRLDPRLSYFSLTNLNSGAWTFLEENAETLWIGMTGDGMNEVHHKNGHVESVTYHPISKEADSPIGVTSILPADSGRLWISTFKGIFQFDKKSRQYIQKKLRDSETGNIFPVIAMRDENERIIFSGIGFHVMDKKTYKIRSFHHQPNDPNSLVSDTTITIKPAGNDQYWIGLLKQGINLFDVRSAKTSRYLPGRSVYAIWVEENGTVWAGTSSGLLKKKPDQKDFSLIRTDNREFSKAYFSSLNEDSNGNLWGTSSLGIFRINKSTNALAVFGRNFGIVHLMTSLKSAAGGASNGDLLIGNWDGYYRFNPSQLANEVPPEVTISGITLNSDPIDPQTLISIRSRSSSLEPLIFRHDQNNFIIQFDGLHFADPETNKFLYQVEGLDEQWRPTSADHTAYLYSLQPRQYLFKYKVISSYGVPSESSVAFTILPPWWQTWWAYISYVVLLIGGVWTFTLWRNRSLTREKVVLERRVAIRTDELRKEKEVVESTLQELKTAQQQLIQTEKMASLGEMTAGIAHEIQNPLNFVNNFSEVSNELLDEMKEELGKGNANEAISIADDVKQNIEKVLHHGKRADAIVKSMLQHSRSSSGQKEPTDINALCDEYLRLAYHGLRAKDKSFSARFETELDPSVGKLNVVSQDIGRVILNLINNAFYAVAEKKKHSGEQPYEPQVLVRTKRNGNQVKISVGDNGNGIPAKVLDKIFQPFFTTKPTGQGTGLGLSLSYDIITKGHGGELKVENSDHGATFIIILPA